MSKTVRWLVVLLLVLSTVFMFSGETFAQESDEVSVVESTESEEVGTPLQDAVPAAVRNINLENWEVVLGFINVLALSFFMKPFWTAGKKVAGMLGWSFVTSGIGLALQDQLDLNDWVGSFLKVASTAIIGYVGVAGPLNLNAKWGLGTNDPPQ